MIRVIYFFSLNLCLEIDINTIEREVVYLSCLFISVFFLFFFVFVCLFQFLDSPSQKFLILTKKWLLTNIFTSTRNLCLLCAFLSICLLFCLFVCLFLVFRLLQN